MTKDNEGRRNDEGNPGPAIEPVDVIKCRECGHMVRRVNTQHLQTDRCTFVDQDKFDDESQRRPNHPETVQEYKDKYPGAPIMSPREKMNLVEKNSNDETDQRRRELMRRRWRGEEMADIVKSLASKYDVTTNAIYKDWSDRERWLPRVFGIEDAEAVVTEALAQKQNVRERLLRVARRAEDTNEVNAAIRALKAVDKNIDDTIEHQRKLGEVASADQTVEVTGKVSHEHERLGDDLDEDELEAIDAITGGEDEEVIDAEFQEVETDGGE